MKPRLFRSLSGKGTEFNKEIDKAKYFFSHVEEALESKEKIISVTFMSKLEGYKKTKTNHKNLEISEKTDANLSELAKICFEAKSNKHYPDSVRLLASRIYYLCHSPFSKNVKVSEPSPAIYKQTSSSPNR